jgi:cell wall-associated NlpC family hydrolase
VVDEAGYGTRAGVVAAARFLVGGLDYKVRYLGPKAVNPLLGSYSKEGLNIGQSNAWGCRVSGWIQGMDCTNFVSWAFAQNGITTFPYNTNHQPVRDVIDKVQVGDLLYTPCVLNTCKNNYRLDHVGIIIGIDDNYIYVAEQTAWGTRVNKKDKHNLPKNGEEFSLVHFYNYSSDGNLTSMWMD